MALGATTSLTSAAANSLMRLYPQDTVGPTLLADLPTLASMPELSGAEGSSLDVTVRYGRPAGVSSQYSNSQANISSGLEARFSVVLGTTYGSGEISGPLLAKAATNKGAIVRALEMSQKELMANVKRSMSFFAFNNGGGAQGRIKAISGSTITLTNPTDSTWLDIDQKIQLSATDGTTGTLKAGGPLIVSGITPRDANGDCVVTFTTGVVATIATAAVGDFIFADGNFGATQTGEERNPVGIFGWLATPGVADSFYGFNRFVRPDLLAGQLASGLTGSYIQQIKRALADFKTLGCTPDVLVMNPLDLDNVTTSLGTLTRFDTRASSVPKVNFSVVKFAGPAGDVDILQDVSCPAGIVLALKMDTWRRAWAGDGFPGYLKKDGNVLRAVDGQDRYRWRMGAYWTTICYEPGKNGRILLTTN